MGGIINLFNLIFTYPIFNILMLLYRVIGDFGLSIIVLTIIVRLVLFPLTLKQLKSMKAMQAIQPQLAEIRKKYKDQRAQLEATQALYKEYGVNPVAGSCLPLLVQMPVLFALFYALDAVLKNATLHSINAIIYPFLPKFVTFPNVYLTWFTFLNPLWKISLGVPDPTHILPILAALATFAQLRMSQARSATTTQKTSGGKDISSQQMIIMQIISPLMVLFFGWNYAAGLALYWMTSSIFGMVQQYFVTGWGSLLVTPSFLGGTNNTSVKAPVRQTKTIAQPKGEEVVDDIVADTPVKSKPKNQYSSSSAARRRSRNSSASARRRGGNVPKRNPSRS